MMCQARPAIGIHFIPAEFPEHQYIIFLANPKARPEVGIIIALHYIKLDKNENEMCLTCADKFS